jgi:NitT/TauT family transport system substrate-binding protein
MSTVRTLGRFAPGLLMLLVLLLVGCGGEETTTETTAAAAPPSGDTASTVATAATDGAPDEITQINVGILPYSGMGPLWLGIEKGIFEANGLDPKLIPAEAPAPILASVQSGQEDFGFATMIALISAVDGGLEVAAVSPIDGTVDPNESSTIIIVGPDSPIMSPADLSGMRVGVPAIGSLIDVLVHAVADRDGVDPESVQTVQVPFPTMWSALQAGRIDAAGITEPFMSEALKAGARNISDAERDMMAGVNVTAFVTNLAFAQENPEVVAKFRKAMAESIAYAKDNVDEVRAIIAKNTGLDPSVAESIKLGVLFDPALNLEGISSTAELMVKYGFIEQVPPVDKIVLPEAQ